MPGPQDSADWTVAMQTRGMPVAAHRPETLKQVRSDAMVRAASRSKHDRRWECRLPARSSPEANPQRT
eukprot:14161457-Alexandrium_andersonii.AAC.1